MADLLKDQYNESYISDLTDALVRAHALFPSARFQTLVFADGWDRLELKARMRRITESLRATLPTGYREALAVILEAAPPFGGFAGMFFPQFVEYYGLDDWAASLPALERLTRFSSSEFAVRPFIKRDPGRMMAAMLAWAEHENEHVRRLASEGCRPRLPWAMALPGFKCDPAPILPVLEQLKRDPSEYVRRSVANNLNDIAKDHPEWVLGLATDWYGDHPHTDWIVKHGCRTLLKTGNPRVMRLFGFAPPEGVRVVDLTWRRPRIAIGETNTFQVAISLAAPNRLRVEYGIDYVKANGSTSRKVFKITENHFPAGVTELTRKQRFADLTTRKHYPGNHRVTAIINGVPLASAHFELTRDS